MRTIFFALLFSSFAFAQETELEQHPRVLVTRTEIPPAIDGNVDADEWKDAASIEDFTQVRPTIGDASEKTRVHLLYDADNLYIGIECFDQDPSAIKATQMQKESNIGPDDVVEIVIDPFADKRNGYYFAITAGGDKVDALVDSIKNQINTDWDTIWRAKAQVGEQGWSAEIAIPYKSISFKGSAHSWGFNIQRTIRRKQEVVKWSGKSLTQLFSDFVQAGKIEGLTGLKQGMGLKVTPYATILTDLNDGKTNLHPGFDVAYKLTPSTTALITVNTDFAEAEVDDQIVNLGRFPLFFPEKRAFFLQDASVFNFGNINQSPLPFYSRRIGFVRGEKKDILSGFKVTGRQGPINFGLLDVQMYDDVDLGRKNLAAMRVQANVLSDSSTGIFVTHGDPSTTGDNTLFGADFNFRTPHAFGDHVFLTSVWALDTLSTEGPANANVPSGMNANDYAVGGLIAFPNDDLYASFFAARYGPNFRPALGFVQFRGTWEIDGATRYRWRSDGFIRRIDPQATAVTFLNLDGSLKILQGPMPGLLLEDQFGDIFYAEHTFDWEVLKAPEDIANVTVPAGSYPSSAFSLQLVGSPNFVVSPNFEYVQGAFFNGSQRSFKGGIDVRPNRYFLLSASYRHIKLSFPNVDDQIIQLARLQANVVFSTQLSWNNIAQFDSQSKSCGFFSRLRYEIEPGQEAFLVVNQGFDVSDDFRWKKADGNLSLKLGMTYFF